MKNLQMRVRNGRTSYEIQFVGSDGKRKTIVLSGRKFGRATAEELCRIVAKLVYYRDNPVESPDKRTLTWIESAPAEIKRKLHNCGLVEIPVERTVKELWDSFLAQKAGEVKESTYELYEKVRLKFFKHFRDGDSLRGLTKERMQNWKSLLLNDVAVASVACMLKSAKTCFNWAVAEGWIDKSPLGGVGRGSFVNKANDYFVSMGEYRALLDASPCQDWRCILALCRIGGLRLGEALRLRWSDIDWENGRFTVRSSKTEHHDDGGIRVVPLFPELREELTTLWFNPETEGKEYVINRYRVGTGSFRNVFANIVSRAGLKKFPRPFDNFRMSRSNEIYRKHGALKESKWIGHSRQTAADHYLDITEDDYTQAAEWTTSEAKNGFPVKVPVSLDTAECQEIQNKVADPVERRV